MENNVLSTDPTIEEKTKTADSKPMHWLYDNLNKYIDSISHSKLDTTCVDPSHLKILFMTLPWPETIHIDADDYCDLLKDKKLDTLIPILCSLKEIMVTESLTETQYALLYTVLYMLPRTLLRQTLLIYLAGRFRFTKESVLWAHLTLTN